MKQPLSVVMRETTSSQFVLWNVWLDKQPNAFDPMKYFLANIAFEVRRSWVKNPNKVKFDPFLLKFETEKKPEPVEVSYEEEETEIDRNRMNISKAFWGAMIKRSKK